MESLGDIFQRNIPELPMEAAIYKLKMELASKNSIIAKLQLKLCENDKEIRELKYFYDKKEQKND